MKPARRFLGVPAPAKINLFLHVVGRRSDGYHEIQSAFVPIDLYDTLDFTARDDGQVVREGDLTGPAEADLAVRAARLLQAQAGGRVPGVTLVVRKRIPVGAGLGGGSSDAATTLLALNRLWDLGLQRAQLAAMGLQLGADVPFFLGSGPAFVEGIGERCTPLALPPVQAVLVYPQAAVSTAEIFADTKLTRDHKPTTIAGFSAAVRAQNSWLAGGPCAEAALGGWCNDLEPVVRRRSAPVAAALRLLGTEGPARMSGSGSAVFSLCPSAGIAQERLIRLRARMPAGWQAWAVSGLEEHPLGLW